MQEVFQHYRQSGDLASKKRVREATNAALQSLPDWPQSFAWALTGFSLLLSSPYGQLFAFSSRLFNYFIFFELAFFSEDWQDVITAHLSMCVIHTSNFYGILICSQASIFCVFILTRHAQSWHLNHSLPSMLQFQENENPIYWIENEVRKLAEFLLKRCHWKKRYPTRMSAYHWLKLITFPTLPSPPSLSSLCKPMSIIMDTFHVLPRWTKARSHLFKYLQICLLPKIAVVNHTCKPPNKKSE